MDRQCIGFDTSNYTTSAAVFGAGRAENRGKLLTVPEGALGLRQSDALFQHVKRLHLMAEQLRADGAVGDIAAVGASTRPREVEGSYMPFPGTCPAAPRSFCGWSRRATPSGRR